MAKIMVLPASFSYLFCPRAGAFFSSKAEYLLIRPAAGRGGPSKSGSRRATCSQKAGLWPGTSRWHSSCTTTYSCAARGIPYSASAKVTCRLAGAHTPQRLVMARTLTAGGCGPRRDAKAGQAASTRAVKRSKASCAVGQGTRGAPGRTLAGPVRSRRRGMPQRRRAWAAGTRRGDADRYRAVRPHPQVQILDAAAGQLVADLPHLAPDPRRP